MNMEKRRCLKAPKNDPVWSENAILEVSNIYFLHLFFSIGIHSMQGRTATMKHIETRKNTKKIKHTRNLFTKNLHIKGVCYS